jgi:Holliday junction DNA helicase RuvA
LPAVNQSCQLYIHAVYREDSASLYGFSTREERDFFCLIVEKVSGIGPKIGISILSRLSVDALKAAILQADTVGLSKCPGIGKKTAERLVIELKDKISLGQGSAESGTLSALAPSDDQSALGDLVASLQTLGYGNAEANKLAKKAQKALPEERSVEVLLKMALS